MESHALIVRCFNEEAHIGRLLSGATRQTLPPDEIILVDSGSTDATLSIASAFGARVEPILPAEFSFGRALNIGLKAAAGHDLCVFASAHVYPVYDTWLEHLLRPLRSDNVVLSYGRQQTPPGGRFSEQRLLTQWFPTESVARQRHPFCNNANSAVRRSAWETLPFDEDLTGLEDLDWAKRALERGSDIAYVAEAPVVHIHDETFAQVVNRYQREAIAHKQIYSEQDMPIREALRLGLINIVGDCREAIREGVLAEHLVDIPRFRIAQFYGTQRGFAQAGPVTEVLRRRFYYPTGDWASRPQHVQDRIGRAIDYDEPPIV